jgi:hypothetical protein
MISHEDHSGRYEMGLMPPYLHYDRCRFPRGGFCGTSISCFPKNELAPPCPVRGPEAGSPPINSRYITIFYGLGENQTGSSAFLQREKILKKTRPIAFGKYRTILQLQDTLEKITVSAICPHLRCSWNRFELRNYRAFFAGIAGHAHGFQARLFRKNVKWERSSLV